jgi:hypothetical protein
MQFHDAWDPRSLRALTPTHWREKQKNAIKSVSYTLTNWFPLTSGGPIATYLILDPPPVSGPRPATNRPWMKSETFQNHRPDCWRIIR